MYFKNIKITLGFLTLVLVSISCNKEEFTVYNIPPEELESSFFDYTDEAIVIDDAKQSNLVVSNNPGELIIKKDESLGEILPNSIVVSSAVIDHDDFILQKVLEVQESGDQYILTTEPASIYQAYKSYYYNSSLSNTIQLRDQNQLFDLGNLKNLIALNNSIKSFSDVDMLISDLLASKKPNDSNYSTDFSFDWELDGEVIIESIHPHLQFAINNPSHELFRNLPDPTDVQAKVNILNADFDSDGDKIADVVEEYYKSSPTSLYDYPIIGRLFINDFMISVTKNIKFGTEKAFEANDFLTANKPPKAEVEVVLAGETEATTIDLSQSPLQKINYVPIPGATTGAFGLAFNWQPLIGLSGSINFDIISKLYTEPTSFVFGVIDFNTSDLDPEYRWESQNASGDSYSLSTYDFLATRLDADFATILKAEAQLQLGLGMGLSAYAGQQGVAFLAVGGMITPYAFMKPSATIGMGFNNILSKGIDLNDANNFYGYGCLAFGMGVEIYAFSDGDDPTQWSNILDTKHTLYTNEIDVLEHILGTKFCIGDTPCEGYEIEEFQLGVTNVDGKNFYNGAIKAKAGNIQDQFYYIEIRRPDGTVLIDDELFINEFKFGDRITFAGFSTAMDEYVYSDNLLMYLVVKDKADCTKIISKDELLIDYCTEYQFDYEENSGTADYKEYMTYNMAFELCSKLNTDLITIDELNQFISDEVTCFNATGYKVSRAGKLLNKDKAYMWITPGTRKVAVIDIQRNPDGSSNYFISEEIASESSLIRCKCSTN